MTSIYVKEKAAQGTPTAAYAQIWAKNTTPASVYIEDDAGNPAAVTMGAITGTLATAAQTNITSLGTLTELQIDNLNINGNTIAGTVGAINIIPQPGFAILLDATISIDAGVITGATSITSTTLTGTLQTASQPNITQVGTLTGFTSTGISDSASGEKLKIRDTRLDVQVPLFIKEIAAVANAAGYGQIWVKNNTPSEFHFYDDAGNYSRLQAGKLWLQGDGAAGSTNGYLNVIAEGSNYSTLDIFQHSSDSTYSPYLGLYKSRGTDASPSNVATNDILGEVAYSAYAGGAWTYSAAYIKATATVATGNSEPTLIFGTGTSGLMSLYADGTLRQGGPIFIKETAAAATDVTGYGQLWIATNGDLMYTSESGVDRVVQTA